MVFVPRTARFHWTVAVGAGVECLAFVAAGVFSLWWWSPDSGGIDPSAWLLVLLSALVLFALAAGFGLGAFLLSLQRVEVRHVGGTVHLFTTAVAALTFVWLDESDMGADPSAVGNLPWIFFAVVAALVAMGLAVLASLSRPTQPEGGRRAS